MQSRVSEMLFMTHVSHMVFATFLTKASTGILFCHQLPAKKKTAIHTITINQFFIIKTQFT